MRWVAGTLWLLVVAACGDGAGSGATFSSMSTSGGGVCEPGALYVCTCADGRSGQRACLPGGLSWEACDCGAGGSGTAGPGSGGGGQGGAGGAGGAGGVPAPECTTDADCEVVLAEELAECGLPYPQCRAGCVLGPRVCALYGPFQCGGMNPCPAAPMCQSVDCVFEGTTSSCVYAVVPDGTQCFPGSPSQCFGGTCTAP